MVLTNRSLKSIGALKFGKNGAKLEVMHDQKWEVDHKVHVYLEYHSVCPLELGHPLPQASVLPPGVHTRLRARGWGCPNSDDWRECLVLCLYDTCTIQLVSNSDNIFKVF